jgi:hypothetical protein
MRQLELIKGNSKKHSRVTTLVSPGILHKNRLRRSCGTVVRREGTTQLAGTTESYAVYIGRNSNATGTKELLVLYETCLAFSVPQKKITVSVRGVAD